MKLYRFNYGNEILECHILKETKKAFVYRLPNSEEDCTVLKKHLDAPTGWASKTIVATSREKLIESGISVVDSNIEFYKKTIKRLQEEKNSILKLLNK